MKLLFSLTFACLVAVEATTPAAAYWLEPNAKDRHLWTIHCVNREDYPLRGDRGDANEFARSICNELTAREDKSARHRAAVFW